MGEYTLAALAAVAVVVALELSWLHTGLFANRVYWLTMLIVIGFQVLVDGWLTKRSAPIVHYREAATSGIRIAWGIPVEDFLFGFALVTLVLLQWEVWGRRARATP